MKIPAVIPNERRPLVEKIVSSLSAVPGAQAVVLGGSFARGTQHADSDLDIGIYYFDASPFEIEEIKRIATEIALEPPTVTGFYGWGPWVNGGAWIRTSTGKVDFLYRSLDQVQRTIDEAIQGKWSHDYDQQPAFGFYSVIYLAETHICLPLYDPNGLVARLKDAVSQYPTRLKQRILSDSLWSAEFTLIHARGFAAVGDVYGTVGCLTRAASVLTQALYALNETYFISDKKALAVAAGFPLLPPGYLEKLASLLAHPGQTPAELAASVSALEALWRAVIAISGDEYRSRYTL